LIDRKVRVVDYASSIVVIYWIQILSFNCYENRARKMA
jgi:hypothetical protein